MKRGQGIRNRFHWSGTISALTDEAVPSCLNEGKNLDTSVVRSPHGCGMWHAKKTSIHTSPKEFAVHIEEVNCEKCLQSWEYMESRVYLDSGEFDGVPVGIIAWIFRTLGYAGNDSYNNQDPISYVKRRLAKYAIDAPVAQLVGGVGFKNQTV